MGKGMREMYIIIFMTDIAKLVFLFCAVLFYYLREGGESEWQRERETLNKVLSFSCSCKYPQINYDRCTINHDMRSVFKLEIKH